MMMRLSPTETTGPSAVHLHVAIFADVNPNLIDGSTIWLQSLARVFAGISGVRTTVVVRDPLTSDVLLRPVIEAGVRVIALPDLLSDSEIIASKPDQLITAFEALHAEAEIDLFVVRGQTFISACARTHTLAPRLWAYWMDRPDIVNTANAPINMVGAAADRIVVQSAIAGATLETVYRIPAEKILVIPPMVPDEAFDLPLPAAPTDPVRLLYSGKIDRSYNVEAYLGLPEILDARGIAATVTVVGDKFNASADDPYFVSRMREALETTPKITWEKGVARVRALELMATGGFGLCWRTDRYDNSLEISTKLLEFSALGVPPLLNRTRIHERLLGTDYPFFVRDAEEIAACVARACAEPAQFEAIQYRLREIARNFSFSSARARMAGALDTLPRHPRSAVSLATPAPSPLRVVVASHDNKFLRRVLDALRRDTRFEIREDRWLGLHKNDLAQSQACIDWADLVFCEWCAGAAAWYSKRLRAGQSCIVRLHRFELFEGGPRHVDFDRVDRLIVVSDWFRQECARRFGIDAERIDVLPQYVDWAQLNRQKHPWAHKTLGMVGINCFYHKRPDRAFDVLEHLVARDPEWRLRIRSEMPWDISWVWQREEERKAFQKLFRRIMSTPALRDAVVFDPPGPDMAEWYRHINYILSPSDTEGCHTSVAEAMASGALPVLHAWPGAESVYPAEFVCEGPAAMAAKLTELQAQDEVGEGQRAHIVEIARSFDVAKTVEHFTQLFLECQEDQDRRRNMHVESG